MIGEPGKGKFLTFKDLPGDKPGFDGFGFSLQLARFGQHAFYGFGLPRRSALAALVFIFPL